MWRLTWTGDNFPTTRGLKLISGCYVGLDNHHRLHLQVVPDIASISFKLAQLTVESEQPNFGPVSPHVAESTSSSTDLSTLLPSCGPFGTVTSRSERQDHFGSDFVVIWDAMSFPSLRLRPFEVGCGCPHDQNSPRISKKPRSPLGSNIASLGLTIFVGFHPRSVH